MCPFAECFRACYSCVKGWSAANLLPIDPPRWSEVDASQKHEERKEGVPPAQARLRRGTSGMHMPQFTTQCAVSLVGAVELKAEGSICAQQFEAGCERAIPTPLLRSYRMCSPPTATLISSVALAGDRFIAVGMGHRVAVRGMGL